ncbi:hypothetical protein AR158_C144R [Paramecium bursaria Chlorella virus AR158]|uniref:hypothetical protein n=1 Tax=Paramecium bursaria Chlorella virus AR158 TaxID=380598 RepID=UPI00015AA7EF|nr:hypothetical protein AR158_C144R [Paramecium bursaria Chlorella virus AR158]ABU43690.1 hypothetical protein AR158_C144R [Paramecium bursaria Chlorella virus AR158]
MILVFAVRNYDIFSVFQMLLYRLDCEVKQLHVNTTRRRKQSYFSIGTMKFTRKVHRHCDRCYFLPTRKINSFSMNRCDLDSRVVNYMWNSDVYR